MVAVKHVIINEEWVWLFTYDELNNRGFKEVFGKEARAFIATIKPGNSGKASETIQDSTVHISTMHKH